MEERPNILLIMSDQQRWDTLGCYGCGAIPTPALDGLAAGGVLFERCYVNATICTPSRACMLTGKPLPGHGVYRLHDTLPDDQVLLPAHLQGLGYQTALVGKLHVSGRVVEAERRHPHDGFDRLRVVHRSADPSRLAVQRLRRLAARAPPRVSAPPRIRPAGPPSRRAALQHLGRRARHRLPRRARPGAAVLPQRELLRSPFALLRLPAGGGRPGGSRGHRSGAPADRGARAGPERGGARAGGVPAPLRRALRWPRSVRRAARLLRLGRLSRPAGGPHPRRSWSGAVWRTTPWCCSYRTTAT